MTTRFRIALLSLATVVSVTSWATPAAYGQDGPQGPPPGGGMRRGMDPERQLQMLTKRLKLTTDQQSQIKSILADRAEKMQAMRNDSSAQGDDRREKMRALMQESNSKIEAVLTDKQKESYKKMQDEMRQRMQERRGGGGDDAPPPPPPQ